MKIKLSKSQWNFIGEKTGWIKTSAINISYTGIVPNDSISDNKVISSQSILSSFKIPEGWISYANHMTINLGGAKENIIKLIGQDIDFSLVAVAQDDKVMAAKVQSSVPSVNETPHITLAVNSQGGKPMMSAKLTDWKPINPIQLQGKILEVAQDGAIITEEIKQKEDAAKQQEQQAKQQEQKAKSSQSPSSIIKSNNWDRNQAVEYLKSKNIPQQAWENILKAVGL